MYAYGISNCQDPLHVLDKICIVLRRGNSFISMNIIPIGRPYSSVPPIPHNILKLFVSKLFTNKAFHLTSTRYAHQLLLNT